VRRPTSIRARPQFQPAKSAEKTSKKIRRNKFMRNIKSTVALATLVAVAAMIGLGVTFPGGALPKVHAQEEALQACSAAMLDGRYGLTFSGYSTTGAVPAPITGSITVAGVGLVTFDGNGNLSASETVNLGGLVMPVNVTGTYTVNSDCTGTFTTSRAHLNLVIVRNGREILAANTDPGHVVVDNFIKQ
jgi:hypothetical protein